jgi:hypothetical protein
MAKPTKAEKRAIRRTIFAEARWRAIVDDVVSIEVLMGMREDSTTDPPFLLNDGTQHPMIFEVTRRCRALAAAYRSIRTDIKGLDIQQPAKRQIRLGFAEEAAVWEARATLWEAAAAGNPDTDIQAIQVHTNAAVAAYQSARKFLPTIDEYDAQYDAVLR